MQVSKQILIMRHAKSSWDDESLSDHDRPLNKRGKKDAPRMAVFLNELDLIPDIILSSSANRARATALTVAEHLNAPSVEVEIVEDLYLAPPGIYLEHLERMADQFNRPMFVGHNPGIESVVHQLSGQWHGMPTAAVACFTVKIGIWSELSENSESIELDNVWRPKEII